MGKSRRATERIQEVGLVSLRLLRNSEFVALAEAARRATASVETAKRAFEWLRDQGAILDYSARARGWHLRNRDFALPMADPTVEDLQSALAAAGLLTALGQTAASERTWALFNELETRLSGGGRRERTIRRDALRVSFTTGALRERRWFLDLLRATRRDVVQIDYCSPWTNEATTHLFEPWQVWLHDGSLYVRGYSRTRRGSRTFSCANIRGVRPVTNATPSMAVPAADRLWGDQDPRFGVDVDRPGDAVVTLHGAVARWVAGITWNENQKDEWLKEGELLRRTLPYRSCRELARKLISVADGLREIEPEELAEAVVAIARKAQANLGRTNQTGDTSTV